jgi:hypothetical protein
MALTPDRERGDVLYRAARELREQPQPGWVELTSRVTAALSTAVRYGVPLRVSLEDVTDPGEDVVHVSDRVVVDAVRRGLAALDGCEPRRIVLRIDDGTCSGVGLDLLGTYGTDLWALAERARDLTLGVLRDVLGPRHGDVTRDDIDVHISDLTDVLPA